MHGQIKPFDYNGLPNYGGFAKAATKINEIRKQVKEDRIWWENGGETMVLDIGNTIMGSQTGWLFANTNLGDKLHPTIEAMNTIKYDAMIYGAGEFSMQSSVRERLHSTSNFPWLSSNVVVGKERSRLTDEYKMLIYKIPTAAHPLRYGVVGLTNPAVFSWEDPNNLTLGSSKLALDDYIEKAREHAESLKETGEKADFIVIATDLGLEKNPDGTWKENLLYQMIQEITHVDFVCSSSPGLAVQQQVFVVPTPSGKSHETLVCQIPENGVTMGRLDLVLEKCTCPVKPYVFHNINGRRDMKSRFVTLDPSVAPDKTILENFRPFEAMLKAKFDVRTGESECDIIASNARRIDNPIAELACTVMMKETGAQFALTDIWTTTAQVKRGSFTFGNLFDFFPKDSKIYKMTLTGQQLKDALGQAATVYHTDSDTNFVIAKGFSYFLDVRPGTKDKVGYMMVGNTPLDLTKVYTVATNSYIALGQGGYNFKSAKLEPTKRRVLDAISNYLKDTGGMLSCRRSGNWFVVPDFLDHWSYEYVSVLVDKKIVAGDKYGRFQPDNFMTRAESSKIVLTIYDHPIYAAPKGKFKDVPPTHWAYPFVEGGVKMGMWFWVQNNLGLNANITREEMMANMIISIGQKTSAEGISAADVSIFEKNFADANDCSAWAKKYVAYATKIGLVGGSIKDGKTYINPKSNIRRSEVAVILAKARFPTIAIMGTADFRTEIENTRLDPDTDRPVGGSIGLSNFVGNIRALYDKTLLLDAGGMISGTAWAELSDSKMATGFMRAMGYDAATLGIRDMYLGADSLKNRIKDFPCDMLAANVDGLAGTKKSLLKDIGGIKVGMIGAVDPDTGLYVCDSDLSGLKINPIAATINAEAKALKAQGAEIIIVIASASGYVELGKTAREGFKGPAAQLASALSGVNILFVSGAPMGFVAPTGTGLWIISPPIGGTKMGVAKVRFDTKSRSIDNVDATLDSTFADLTDSMIRPAAKQLIGNVKNFVDSQKTQMKAEVEQVIGRTESGLAFDDSNESLLGDLITEYTTDKLGVDLVVFPSDQMKKGIAPGPITVKDVYTCVPINDNWVKGKVLGSKIKDICESSIAGERGVLQIEGFSFVFTRTKDPGNRVSEIYIDKNGEKTEVDRAKIYTIAMPAREFYALPGFAHEVLHQVVTDTQNTCINLRKSIFEYIKKLTEGGQPVNKVIKKKFTEP